MFADIAYKLVLNSITTGGHVMKGAWNMCDFVCGVPVLLRVSACVIVGGGR